MSGKPALTPAPVGAWAGAAGDDPRQASSQLVPPAGDSADGAGTGPVADGVSLTSGKLLGTPIARVFANILIEYHLDPSLSSRLESERTCAAWLAHTTSK